MTNDINETINELPKEFENYDYAKQFLIIRLNGIEGHEEALREMPYTIKEDLAVTFHLLVSGNEEEEYTVPVTNTLMENYDVSVEKLYEDALENSERMLKPMILSMDEVLLGMEGNSTFKDVPPKDFDGQLEHFDFSESGMYVLTNEKSMLGAAVIAYDDILDKVAAHAGENLFIIPSSVHEVIILKDDGVLNYRELESMVRDVNQNEVQPKDRLSDHVYHYDRDNRLFEKAADFEARAFRAKLIKRPLAAAVSERKEEYAGNRTSIKDQLKEAERESGKQLIKGFQKKEPEIS